MHQRRTIGNATKWGMCAALMCGAGGVVQAVPNVEDGVGDPDDTYWIPEGYFAPGVPAVGTLEQQMMMADAVEAMWVLGDAMRQDVIDFGDQGLLDLDAFIALGPEPWEVYDAAVELEKDIEDRARANQQIIGASVETFFLPVQNSLPAPPTDLLAAAFGPTLTSISLLFVEVDYYVLEYQSRRPMERPDEPAPAFVPSPVHATPEPAPSAAPMSGAPANQAVAPPETQSPAQAQPPVVLSRQEIKQQQRLERKRAKQEAKRQKRLERMEKKRLKQLERQRKKQERLERKRLKKLEKQRRRAAARGGA